jgi:hypothetical protein
MEHQLQEQVVEEQEALEQQVQVVQVEGQMVVITQLIQEVLEQ